MSDNPQIDLRAAINAISDVVKTRPRPLRDFDQIYMKTGDMVLQSELVAHWADKKRLAFIGDGDAAAELGKLGGQKTAERGPEYYAEIQAMRKVRSGGRPPGPPKATHSGILNIGDRTGS